MRRLLLAAGLGIALALVIVWLWFGRALRPSSARPADAASGATGTATAGAPGTPGRMAAGAGVPGAATPPADARKIRAMLFYVADDGVRLVGVDREVPYAETPVDQARALVSALLEPVPEPLAQAVPAGTTLRALFLTEKGDAYVDLSPEVSSKHPGGALEEMLTVYAIVDTLTVNLPAITRVQILVGGKEVDTLAGHLDLRRPLAKNLQWTRPPGAEAGQPQP